MSKIDLQIKSKAECQVI